LSFVQKEALKKGSKMDLTNKIYPVERLKTNMSQQVSNHKGLLELGSETIGGVGRKLRGVVQDDVQSHYVLLYCM